MDRRFALVLCLLAVLLFAAAVACTCDKEPAEDEDDDSHADDNDTDDDDAGGDDIAEGWYVYMVDPETGWESSMAIDTNHRVYIAYGYSSLKYATNLSGEWAISELDDAGGTRSIALDPFGAVHISYAGVKYATNASGSWTTEEFGSGPVFPDECHSSIAVDSDGKAHISYFTHKDALSLGYATNASGEWEKVLVDQGSYGEDTEIESVGLFNSIALDSEGHVHISYYCDYNDYDPDKYGGELRYATNASGAWEITAIEWSYAEGDICGTGGYTSIAIDSDNYVHISYYDATNDSLKYATNRPPEE